MTKRIDFSPVESVSFFEPDMRVYVTEDLQKRTDLLDQIRECGTPSVIVSLPFGSFVKGPGLGFSLQVQEAITGAGYNKLLKFELKPPVWGSPVDTRKLVLIGSPWPLRTLPNQKPAVVADWDSSILHHALIDFRFSKIVPGLFPGVAGVVRSRLHPFASPIAYKNNRPTVVKKDGDSFSCRVLTPHEWSSVFGIEPPEHPSAYEVVTPTKVVNSLLKYASESGDVLTI